MTIHLPRRAGIRPHRILLGTDGIALVGNEGLHPTEMTFLQGPGYDLDCRMNPALLSHRHASDALDRPGGRHLCNLPRAPRRVAPAELAAAGSGGTCQSRKAQRPESSLTPITHGHREHWEHSPRRPCVVAAQTRGFPASLGPHLWQASISRSLADGPGSRPLPRSSEQADDDQQDHGADRRVDDRGDERVHDDEGDADPRQQPAREEGADDADDEIADQAEPVAPHEHAGQPAGDDADDEQDQDGFSCHVALPLADASVRGSRARLHSRPRPRWRWHFPGEREARLGTARRARSLRRELTGFGAEIVARMGSRGGRAPEGFGDRGRGDQRIALAVVPGLAHGQAELPVFLFRDQEGLQNLSRHGGAPFMKRPSRCGEGRAVHPITSATMRRSSVTERVGGAALRSRSESRAFGQCSLGRLGPVISMFILFLGRPLPPILGEGRQALHFRPAADYRRNVFRLGPPPPDPGIFSR